MARHGIAGLTLGIFTLAFGAGCFYLEEKLSMKLDQGDVTGVVVGTPPNALSRQNIVGARVRVRGSAMVRTTNADGRFVVRNLPAGNHLLEISFDPNRDGVTDLGKLVRVPVRVMGGRRSAMDLGEVELLKPGNVVGDIGPSTDAPFDNVMVNLFQENPGVPGSFELTDLRVFAQTNGAFDIGGVGEGSWEVQAARAGMGSNAARIAVVPETAAPAGTLLLDQPATGTISGSLLPPVENTELSGVGVVTQGLDGFDGVVLLRLTSTTNVLATPLVFELNDRIIDVRDVPADVYTVEIDFPPNERTPDPVNAYLDVSFPFVVVAGRPCNLGQLIASRLPPPSSTCPGGDQDGDGECFAGDLHCAADCRAGAASCVEEGKRWDCDDDGDGQADVVEMLGDTMSGPCRCGVAGPRPLGSAGCEQDAFRADQDFDGICDMFDRFPACALNRFPCQAEPPDAGIPDAAVEDASTLDAAQPPDGGLSLDASVPPDAGTPDAAVAPDAAGPFGFTELKEVAIFPADGGPVIPMFASLYSLTVPVPGGGALLHVGGSAALAFNNALNCPLVLPGLAVEGPGYADALVRVDANGQCLWRREVDALSAGTQLGGFYINGLAAGFGRIYVAALTTGGIRVDGVEAVPLAKRGYVVLSFPDNGASTFVHTMLLELDDVDGQFGAWDVLGVDATTGGVSALFPIPSALGIIPGVPTIQGYGLMDLDPVTLMQRRPPLALYPSGRAGLFMDITGFPNRTTQRTAGSHRGSFELGTLAPSMDGGVGITPLDGGFPVLTGPGTFVWDPLGQPTPLPLRLDSTDPMLQSLPGTLAVVPGGSGGLDVAGGLFDATLQDGLGVRLLEDLRGEHVWAAHLNGTAVEQLLDLYNSPPLNAATSGRLDTGLNVSQQLRASDGNLVLVAGLEHRQRLGLQGTTVTQPQELLLSAPANAQGPVVSLLRVNNAGGVIQHAVAYAADVNSSVLVQGAHATADNAVILTLAVKGTVHVQQQTCPALGAPGMVIPGTVETFSATGLASVVLWRVTDTGLLAAACQSSNAVNNQANDLPDVLDQGTPTPGPDQTLAADIGPGLDQDCMAVLPAAGQVLRLVSQAADGCDGDVLFDLYGNSGTWSFERTVGCGETVLPAGNLVGVCARGFSGYPAGPVSALLQGYPPPNGLDGGGERCDTPQAIPDPTAVGVPNVDVRAVTWNGAANFNPPDCAPYATGPDVFFSFTASRTGRVELGLTPGTQVSPDFYPVFAAYQDCGNQQLQAACGTGLRTYLNVISGNTYVVSVSGDNGSQGEASMRLTFEPPASNDLCSMPTALSGTVGSTNSVLTVPFSFVLTAGEYDATGGACSAFLPAPSDVYFTFTTGTEDGVLVFNTLASAYLDGSIHIFTGGCGVTAVEEGCTYTGSTQFPMPVRRNTTYTLVLASASNTDDETGTLSFDFQAATANDACSTPDALGTLSAATPTLTRMASNFAATSDNLTSNCSASAPLPSDVYFTFVAGEAGFARVRAANASFSGQLAVWDMNEFGCGMPSAVTCVPALNLATPPFAVVAGRTYTVAVGGQSPLDQGRFELVVDRVTAAGNDLCDNASMLSVGNTLTSVTMASNLACTGEFNPANTACMAPPTGGEPDSWWLLTGTGAGLLQVRVNNLADNVQLMAYLLDTAACAGTPMANGGCAFLNPGQWTTLGVLGSAQQKLLVIKGLNAVDQTVFDLDFQVVRDNEATDVCFGQDITTAYGPTGLMGGSVTANNDYEDDTLGNCIGPFNSAGPDVTLSATVGPGETLALDYWTTGDASLLVLDGCPGAGAATCVAGADGSGNQGRETLQVTNSSAAAVTYVIVLDQYSGSGGFDYTLQWTLTP